MFKGIKLNHRPISLLHLIRKVISKTIHDQTQDFLQRNELFYIYQSGFGAIHSADACLSRLRSMILNGAEYGKNTGMIFKRLFKRSSKDFCHFTS